MRGQDLGSHANPNRKLLGLEIIRFISAVAVILYHYRHFSYVADKPTNFIETYQPFYPFLKFFYEYGFLGVQVFWCISGFIFFWKYRASISSNKVDGRTFFILRFSRLYPLHFVTLMLVALLQFVYFNMHNYSFVVQENTISQFVLQLFMASTWGGKAVNVLLHLFTPFNWDYGKVESFNGPIWSISVEVVIYLVFYVVLRLVGGSWIVNALIIAGMATSKLILGHHHSFIDCLYFFYAGGLCAMIRQSISGKAEVAANMLALCLILLLPISGWLFGLSGSDFFYHFFLLTFIPALIFLVTLNFDLGRANKYIEAAGNMTYSSYLIHFPIQIGIALIFSGTAIPWHSPVLLGVFLSVTLLAAYFIYKYLEAPAQNAIRKRMLRASPSVKEFESPELLPTTPPPV